ncbi:LytR/AlgR family response regulator transcription factor [Aequorivita xiaoshiensis]|uniref:LytTR family DNA-binding domain-containing protein n=1 Tax=Aequorivita xiaoshiensis TaxID=2874476 RepID=A0A9X1UDX6_9FLAO|nr:LytTR family DNA-binding domain-containing protein [Aequorivita xiaoshiensis]MCG2432046.1 LytTR family DNA-binding domain-containing protein [Aequorivita xiaoshiensis]
MIKALVIDDEKLARRRVLHLLEEVPDVEVLGECSNGKSAILNINQQKPDLIFLDINMKDMNGFEVLKNISISPKPIVIFVTAYDNYALKAFDVDAFDFLLKPFKDHRFFRTIDKVRKISTNEADHNFEKRIIELFNLYENRSSRTTELDKLPVKQGNKTILINPIDILYISASGSYAEIFVRDRKYVLRETLNNLCELLDDDKFIRVHRSTILNIHHIREIVHSGFSELDARMNNNCLLRISKSYKKEFLQKVGL